MEDTATVAQLEHKADRRKPEPFDPERFLKNNIVKPEGTTMVIKRITEHFFRVNFFAQSNRSDVVKDWTIVKSQMIEVVYEDGVAKLVDRTISPVTK